MAIFEPVRNMWGIMAKASDSAGALLETAETRGMAGVVRSLLGLDAEGMKKMVDETLGVGIIGFLLAGEKAAVDTVLLFRDFLMDFLDELKILAGITVKFGSDEPEKRLEAVGEMKVYMTDRKSGRDRVRRERALQREVEELRALVKQISQMADEANGEEECSSDPG